MGTSQRGGREPRGGPPRAEPAPAPSRRSVAPKGTGDPAAPRGPVTVCRLRVALPEPLWIGRLSRRFPEARIEVLARIELAGGATLTDLRVTAPEPVDWAREILALDGVRTVEALGSSERSADLRVTHAGRGFVPLLARLQLLRQFPFPILAGEASWTIVSDEGRLRELVRELREQGTPATIESIRPYAGPATLGSLSARQRELLDRSVAFGYFEVPRRISLTELADRLGVSKSTLSEGLAIVERKLVEAAETAGPTR